MKGNVTLTTVFLLVVITSLYACEDKDTIILQTAPQPNVMRVVGSSTLSTKPNIAIAQIGVQTISSELDPALIDNNKKVDAVINALRQQGVEDKDIKTTAFNVYPLRDYKNNDPNRIVGYQVDNVLSVTFRKMDNIGRGLQSAINAGANNVIGIYFSVSDAESLKNEARTKAIQDAKRKAESMAQSAGINLGKIISINEISASVPITPKYDYSRSSPESAVPVQPGELEITVQVEIVYELP